MTSDPRIPPHNFEAEQSVLGALMMDAGAYDRVCDIIRPEHFAEPAHSRVYEVVEKLAGEGRKHDLITVKSILERDGTLAEIGGPGYLAACAAAVTSTRNVSDHARIVHDLHLRRCLIAEAESLLSSAYEMGGDPATALQEEHESRLFELSSQGNTGKTEFVGFDDAGAQALATFDRAHKHRGEVTGVSTGLIDIDKRLGGLHPSDLIILGARPAMGKTALAVNIAASAARRGVPVGIFELEMGADQLAARVLCAHAGVSSEKARLGELTQPEFDRLEAATRDLRALPLYTDPTPALTVTSIRTRARRLARRKGIGLVIVDHIGLAAPTQRRASKVHEIEEITNGLKALAKELQVPVLALCQLSRQVEQREDKRPQLSDLRDSGSIEADADVVCFLFREQYYLERSEPFRRPDESDQKFNDRLSSWEQRCSEAYGIADIIIAKNRHGRTGTVRAHFDGDTQRFSNLATEDAHNG